MEFINFDENSNFLSRSVFTQDYREPFSKCWLVFPLENWVDFKEGAVGFIFKGHEWDVVSCKKVQMSGNIMYSVMGFPRGVCSVVNKKYLSLSALARGLDLKFDSDISSDLKFEFPLNNMQLGVLLYKYRMCSIEQYSSKLNQAYFLFYDNRGLFGITYGDLSKKTTEFDMDFTTFTGGSFNHIMDSLYVKHSINHSPAFHRYDKFITSLIGDKLDVIAMSGGVIGHKYKLTGSYEEIFSQYDNLILVRQKFDSSKSPPWSLTFGQLLI